MNIAKKCVIISVLFFMQFTQNAFPNDDFKIVEKYGQRISTILASRQLDEFMNLLPKEIIITDGSDYETIKTKMQTVFEQFHTIKTDSFEIKQSPNSEYEIKIHLKLLSDNQEPHDYNLYFTIKMEREELTISDIYDDNDLKITNFEVYQEGLNFDGLTDNISKLKEWYCGIWVGKDIEIVRTQKMEIKFERDKEKPTGLWSQFSLLRYTNEGLEQNIRALVYANKKDRELKIHAKNFGSFSNEDPFISNKELSSKVIAKHYKIISVNDTLIVLKNPDNSKEYVYSSGLIRNYDSNDGLTCELNKIESIEILRKMPEFEKASETTIGKCLYDWQLGSMVLNEHKNKQILNKALITTNNTDYIFMIKDDFCYCRKGRYIATNKGIVASRGDIRLMVNPNEFTSYMPRDHIERANRKLVIDESKFDPTQCIFQPDVIYWSLKKIYDDKIELHGCGGMTYPYYLPKSKNSKVEWFSSL